ncbi:glycosyltransferase [Paenibacillus sp. N1-5-1-14]|uniref:tetratricopeptide repeat-containing glycosyltransferase family 2 protein n=1 Tax=Paenibacillus radicibacter TaxID=2972488 RepID=UPI002158D995|nr:glycosyltransferase [Paenibacillus radicibacter]MCR8641214.1 glycosyltransferase [Paenibacillus radicibacter]
MIVKNEEHAIGNCLSSVQDLVDEIIIVDTGSKDRTKEIVREYTEHIHDFEWINNFAAARNYSSSFATKDYVLYLDADDVLLEEDRTKFLLLKESLDPEVDVVSMDYHCAFDDHGIVALNVRRYRLAKRSKGFQWEGFVHEDLVIQGVCMNSDIAITHTKTHGTPTDRNLNIYEEHIKNGKVLSSRDLSHYARELHHRDMLDRAIPLYLQFLKHPDISDENRIHACGLLADCYQKLDDYEQEIAYVFKSFAYDVPRPEFCCRLGYHYLQSERFNQAIYWYTVAANSPLPSNSWEIVNFPSRTWLPQMQLGLCYFKIGDYEASYDHNLKALEYRPDDEQIRTNTEMLKQLLMK